MDCSFYNGFIYVTAPVIMNRTTNSLIFLIVISMFLPTSAIMYASGQSTDNSDILRSGTGESIDNSGSSSTGGGSSTTTPDNSGSSSTGGGSSTTTDNSTPLLTIPTARNDTENPADLINSVLTVHNRERAAVGSPPLTWSDTLAAGAKTWAEHLAATDKFEHDLSSANSGVGENILTFTSCCGKEDNYKQGLWVGEKVDWHVGVLSHYGQMIWKNTKEVGCGTASEPSDPSTSFLVCRYTPGIFN